MSDQKVLLCYTTVKSVQEAKDLARKAIEDQVAGCVNILPEILSVYRWEGGLMLVQSASCYLNSFLN